MTRLRTYGTRVAVAGTVVLGAVIAGLWHSSGEAATTPLSAPNAYVTTNVNQRAGPGTEYPVIVTVPSLSYVTIYGCVRNYVWCEVGYQTTRGWMRASYLQAYDSGRYMPVEEYGPRVQLPIVAFDIHSYWSTHYRNRPFYAEMARYVAPRPPPVTPSVFYRPLSPYGSWVWLRGQYVWVPDRVDPRWRPYTEGRWVYTRYYGWTWVSDEPFGWATYHYGRWGFSNRIGWFWVPGTRWAPAWVTWRASDDYLAWAPLPPEPDHSISISISIGTVPDYYWQAVPTSSFLSVNLSRHIIRDDRRFVPVLRETRPLGNVNIVNNVVVNNVVNVQYIEQKTEEKVVIHEVAATGSPEQTGEIKDGTLQLLTATAAASDPSALAEAPPEVKTVDEVATVSPTKEQASDQLTTEELLVEPLPGDAGGAPEQTAPAGPAELMAPPAAEALATPPAEAPVEPSPSPPTAELPPTPTTEPAPSELPPELPPPPPPQATELPAPEPPTQPAAPELPPPQATELPPPPAAMPSPPAAMPPPQATELPSPPLPPADLPAPPAPMAPADMPSPPAAMPPPPQATELPSPPLPPGDLPAPPAAMPPPAVMPPPTMAEPPPAAMQLPAGPPVEQPPSAPEQFGPVCPDGMVPLDGGCSVPQ